MFNKIGSLGVWLERRSQARLRAPPRLKILVDDQLRETPGSVRWSLSAGQNSYAFWQPHHRFKIWKLRKLFVLQCDDHLRKSVGFILACAQRLRFLGIAHVDYRINETSIIWKEWTWTDSVTFKQSKISKTKQFWWRYRSKSIAG